MKTEQLVAALVEDRAGSTRPLGRSLLVATAAGSMVSVAIFAAEFGSRDDLMAAFATWRFDLKLVLVLTALVAAFAACRAMARPVPSTSWRVLVQVAAVLAAAALVVELVALPAEAWRPRLVGSNAVVCLTTIPLFALAPLAVLLVVMRRTAAPSSPGRAGAAAGALAAAVAATIYAFHCFDDSPLFVLTWYPLAALPVIGVAAIAGHRMLRW